MRIKTNTTFTPSGKMKVKTTVRAAPMLPALRSSATYDLMPTPKKKRRTKKKR